jgi:hypothetical protein
MGCFIILTYVSSLNSEFYIISKGELFFHAFGLREVEEYLLDNICAFNEAEALFHRANDPLVTHWVSGIFKSSISGGQVTTSEARRYGIIIS